MLWGWIKGRACGYWGPSYELSSRSRNQPSLQSSAAALTFSMATFRRDQWLALAGAVLFLACKCSDLSCLQGCMRPGIRAALMSALIHLKAAQNDFIQ